MSATEAATEMTITPDELAERLPEILERARVNGDRFVVVQHGRPIAVLGPPNPPAISIADLIAEVGDLEMPGDGFADDLEAAQASQQPPKAPDWPD